MSPATLHIVWLFARGSRSRSNTEPSALEAIEIQRQQRARRQDLKSIALPAGQGRGRQSLTVTSMPFKRPFSPARGETSCIRCAIRCIPSPLFVGRVTPADMRTMRMRRYIEWGAHARIVFAASRAYPIAFSTTCHPPVLSSPVIRRRGRPRVPKPCDGRHWPSWTAMTVFRRLLGWFRPRGDREGASSISYHGSIKAYAGALHGRPSVSILPDAGCGLARPVDTCTARECAYLR